MRDCAAFIPVAEGIAKLMHPFAEVVIHDLASNQILAIFNSFSRRAVGDNSLVEDLAGIDRGPDIHGPFVKNDFEGRKVKTISVVLRDEAKVAVGMLCINMNVSGFEVMGHQIQEFIAASCNTSSLDVLFEEDWQERIRTFVQQFLRERHLSQETLTKERRRELIHALERAGAFKAKNAHGFTAQVLGISRATIYNDLGTQPSK